MCWNVLEEYSITAGLTDLYRGLPVHPKNPTPASLRTRSYMWDAIKQGIKFGLRMCGTKNSLALTDLSFATCG